MGILFTGYKVDVIFDPSDTEVVTIEYENHPPFTARELQIGEFTGKKPKLPKHMTAVPASESRLLNAAEKRSVIRKEQVRNAIAYRSKAKGGC